MAFGLGRLRLSPQEFWAMTPREIGCAMSVFGRSGIQPPKRGDLERLMAAFPDGGGTNGGL